MWVRGIQIVSEQRGWWVNVSRLFEFQFDCIARADLLLHPLPSSRSLPPADLFPISKMTLELVNGDKLEVDNVQMAQQYNLTMDGCPELRAWATALTRRQQRPACETETVLTSGSNSALDLLAFILLERGDCIAVDEFHFPVLVEGHALPEGVEVVSVGMDGQGVDPTSLEAVLADRARRGLALPKMLYTIPVAQNPTGAVASAERLAEVYRVCAKYGLLILEDDPYYFLQYPRGAEAVPGTDLPPGYLSVDRDGRVIRIDSLSKILAPGLRLGWVTCAPAIARKVALTAANTSTGVSGISAAVARTLVRNWGEDGFDAHARSTQAHYAAKAAACDAAARRHLADVATWDAPKAGMFMWLRLSGMDTLDSAALVEAMREEQVIAVPASAVSIKEDRPFLRVSFSYGNPEQIDEGVRRLGAAIRRCMAAQKVQAQ